MLVSEAEIQADPQAVYDVIADVSSYKDWNPFNTATNVTSPVKEGDLITLNSNLGNRKMTVRHRILEMKPGEKFTWCDVGFFTYFAYGERTRYLTETERGTHYRVELKISGMLSWLAKIQFSKLIQPGMDAEAKALQRRTEFLSSGNQ